ncbi:hypothetical protein [Paenibacillus cymbidii]|uniref:hypothetical protein n=1 Tax=Paenibacillus cymbidii TaxID=1639034 RepID=UPI0010812FE9|nr:hypothetical protein [Paenibacillus cymbidii]
MNLTEMLSYADIRELDRIARHYDCECGGHSKHELIQSILTALNRRDLFERQIEGMPVTYIRLLDSLASDKRESFTLEELTARVKMAHWDADPAPAASPRDIIADLKRRGWLFSGFSEQTKYLFQVPDDMKRRFTEVLAGHFRRTLVMPTSSPAVYRDEQQLFGEDMLQFLRLLAHEPMPLADTGSLYKRQLQLILDSFTVEEEQVARTAFRFGYGRRFKEYPNRFSLMYDYCYYNGYIEEDGPLLKLGERGDRLVASGQKPGIVPMFRFWLRLYKGPVASIGSVARWIERLAKPWTTVVSLGAELMPLIKPYYYDTPASIFEQRIVMPMMHLGLLRIGQDEEYGQVVQMTKLGSGVVAGSTADEEEAIRLDLPEDGATSRSRYDR